MFTTLGLISRKLQKTEEVTVKTKTGQNKRNGKNIPYLYFEGKELVGYLLLTRELIDEIKKLEE